MIVELELRSTATGPLVSSRSPEETSPRNARYMSATSRSTGRSLRILCADDTSQITGIIQDALQLEGHSVTPVCDGLEAYRAIMAAPEAFDVLITDHRMPQLSGLSLVAKLRDISFSGVVIVHSSNLSESDLAGYRSLAVDHIVMKPSEFGRLIAIIREISKQWLRAE